MVLVRVDRAIWHVYHGEKKMLILRNGQGYQRRLKLDFMKMTNRLVKYLAGMTMRLVQYACSCFHLITSVLDCYGQF